MEQRTITDIEGVFAAGINCGIKKQGRDLAFIYVPAACAAAGVFTRNRFAASSIVHTAACLRSGLPVRAAIINSGNANAVTGERGAEDTKRIAALAAARLGLNPQQVAVASTGIIGQPLPMEKIESGLAQLLEDPRQRDGLAALRAIMTTDTREKQVHLERSIAAETVSVAGIAKGSGMIAPNMATMLAFLVTDAQIEQHALQQLLAAAADDSFNMLSVDGDTSTNDMVLLFATGARPLAGPTAMNDFKTLLTEACQELARRIAADGEGATRLIAARVEGAATLADARRIARNIINSPLVKTALHGCDPNWGRIIAAAGKDPECAFDVQRVTLLLQGVPVLSAGRPCLSDREGLVRALHAAEVEITLRLGGGPHGATAWGCDLSKQYVDINTDYN